MVGVPVIAPVEALSDRPNGRSVALQVRVLPVAVSDAWTCRVCAVPTVPAWVPGLVTVTVGVALAGGDTVGNRKANESSAVAMSASAQNRW